MTFTHKILNIDLRYYDTNLSKENCYVFTGDPNAASGGRINPITNPDGLMSRWCSATLVAKALVRIELGLENERIWRGPTPSATSMAA